MKDRILFKVNIQRRHDWEKVRHYGRSPEHGHRISIMGKIMQAAGAPLYRPYTLKIEAKGADYGNATGLNNPGRVRMDNGAEFNACYLPLHFRDRRLQVTFKPVGRTAK